MLYVVSRLGINLGNLYADKPNHRLHQPLYRNECMGRISDYGYLVVTIGFMGLKFIRVTFLERFGNVFAGFAIAGSGLAIQLLGI